MTEPTAEPRHAIDQADIDELAIAEEIIETLGETV